MGWGGRGHGVVRGLVCRDRAGHWGGRFCDGLGGEGARGCERFGMQGQGWALGGGGCDGLGGRGHGVVRGLVCRDRAGHWGGGRVVMGWGGGGGMGL